MAIGVVVNNIFPCNANTIEDRRWSRTQERMKTASERFRLRSVKMRNDETTARMMLRVQADMWAVIVLVRETDEISRERFQRERKRKKEGDRTWRVSTTTREIEIVSLDPERKLEDPE